MRFVANDSNVTNPTDNKITVDWLNTNEDYLSAWSTVCLIKGLNRPTLTLTNKTSFQSLQSPHLTVAGTFNFQAQEKEHIYSY
jgi:hypothetical protein